MKLYTEEQVVNALNRVFIESITIEDVNEVMRSLTPIELPSDEEIEQLFPKTNTLYEALGRLGMIEGAKQLRDKIQEGKQ